MNKQNRLKFVISLLVIIFAMTVFGATPESFILSNKDIAKTVNCTLLDTPCEADSFYQVKFQLKGENIVGDKGITIVKLFFGSGPKKNFNSFATMQEYWLKDVKMDCGPKEYSRIFGTSSNVEQMRLQIQLRQTTGTVVIDNISVEKSTYEAYLAQEKAEITNKIKPDLWREQYGTNYRQVINLYKAPSDKPTPLVIDIHGGGWRNGDGIKEADSGRKDGFIAKMHKNGISVAVINYSLEPLPSPVMDAVRAVQFLKYHAKDYNLDPNKFLATGHSAGATSSLLLALHDDFADPQSSDPISRESSRLVGAMALEPQTSIDPMQIKEWKNDNANNHYMIPTSVGFVNSKEMWANYETKKALYKEFSPVTHVDKDDPIVMLVYRKPINNPDGIHNGIFGNEFQKAANAKEVKSHLLLHPDDKNLNPTSDYTNGDTYIIKTLKQK